MRIKFPNDELVNALEGSESEAERILQDPAKTEETLSRAKKLLKKVENLPVISDVVAEVETAIELVQSYIDGKYREVPLRVVIAVMGGLLYLLAPIDLIPDFLLPFGFFDDVAVLALIFSTGVSIELEHFRKWKLETARQKAVEKARDDYIRLVRAEVGGKNA